MPKSQYYDAAQLQTPLLSVNVLKQEVQMPSAVQF
jgi:hypothetical protein